MIMDADVLFEPTTLRRMARHFADPEVGGVTAYVKEGSEPASLLSRFITFEYVTAQAAARRAQNVAGGIPCMAGGAQLHSRENLIAIGGRIDTSTLAEDTYTTIKTQICGRRALFDPNAIVWAEEPDSLTALWKQRLRWGRGNLQITMAFRDLWFRPSRSAHFGNFAFGVLWFSIALMPVFMILGSVGLVGLFYLWPPWVPLAFSVLWGVTFVSYLFQTLYSLLIDPQAARHLLVPRLRLSRPPFDRRDAPGDPEPHALHRLGQVARVRQFHVGRGRRPGHPVLVGALDLVGMGCLPGRPGGRAEVAAQHPAGTGRLWPAVVRHLAGRDHRPAQEFRPEMGQDGQVRQGTAADMTPAEKPAPDTMPADTFVRMQAEDMANEVRVLWSEIGVMAFLALLVAIYVIVA